MFIALSLGFIVGWLIKLSVRFLISNDLIKPGLFKPPIIEMTTAIIYALILVRTGFTYDFILYGFLTYILGVIALTDAFEKRIYDWIIGFGFVVIVPLQLLIGQMKPMLYGMAVGFGLTFFAYWYGKWRHGAETETFGQGDVLLVTLIGAALGVLGVTSSIIIATLLCLGVGTIIVIRSKVGISQLLQVELPVGSYIIAGIAIDRIKPDGLFYWFVSILG